MREWPLRHLPSVPQPMHSESAAAPPRLPKTLARNSSNTPHHRASPRHTWNSTWCLLVSFLSRENPQKSQQILLSSRNRVNPHPDRSFSPSSAWPPLSPHPGRKSGSSAKFRESSSCLSSIAPPCAQKFHRTSTCLLVCAPTHFPRNYLISSA